MPLCKTSVNDAQLTQFLELLGKNCPPLQWLREIPYNSIESIGRTKLKRGLIHIDINHELLKNSNGRICKISIIDTGVGLCPEELQQYVNKLASSNREKSQHENYGIGGLISTLPRNKFGVMYDYWKDGKGYRSLLKYSKEENAFGLEQFELSNGEYRYHRELEEDSKPAIIGQNGVRVTLLGHSEEENTMDRDVHNALGNKESWTVHYLNKRFLRFPDGIKIMCRIGYDREGTRHNFLHHTQGLQATINKWSKQKGSVQLTDANVCWYILKPGYTNKHKKFIKREGHGREFTQGHVCLINQYEVFELSSGKTNLSTRFGITVGQGDVVLHIEPNPKKYFQDAFRITLKSKNSDVIPWERWAEEFRQQMPELLREYVKKCLLEMQSESHADSIRHKLKKIEKFYRISRFRKNKNGLVPLDDENIIKYSTGKSNTKTNGQGEGTSKKCGSGSFKELLSAGTKVDSAVMGEEVSPNPFPEVKWVQEDDERVSNYGLKDRAAAYNKQANIIFANKSFAGYTDVIEHLLKEYERSLSLLDVKVHIEENIRELFEQQLTEAVAFATHLIHREKWTTNDFERAISPEALTTAIGPRYYIIRHAKNKISNILGHNESQSKKVA